MEKIPFALADGIFFAGKGFEETFLQLNSFQLMNSDGFKLFYRLFNIFLFQLQ